MLVKFLHKFEQKRRGKCGGSGGSKRSRRRRKIKKKVLGTIEVGYLNLLVGIFDSPTGELPTLNDVYLSHVLLQEGGPRRHSGV